MSTCRVTSLNSTAVPGPAAAAPAAPAIEPALVFHTDYEWNSSGTRIRCAHAQCRAVFQVPEPGDVEKAEALFAEHQAAVLGAIPVELAALRRLKDAMPSVLADLAHGVSVLRIEAELFRLVNETDLAIGNARDLLIEVPSPKAPAIPVTEADPAPEVPDAPAAAPEPEAEPEPTPADTEAHVEEEPPTEEKAPDEEPPAEELPEPEPVPEESADTVHPEEAAPARPPVDVAGVAAGDRVLAVFETEKQGVFDMEATVIDGLGQDQLVVGSWLISSNGTASAHLREVTVLAAAGTHDKPVKPGSNAPEHFGTGI